MGAQQRLRLDGQVIKHYNFVFPPPWLSSNTLPGQLKRMWEKRTDFVPRLESDDRDILEKEVDPLFKVFFSKRGQMVAKHGETGYTPIQGITKFREKHFQLMMAYNHAASPDFHKVSLTALFEYHQWLMEKLQEGLWTPEYVYEYMQADYNMRTKWNLSWQQQEFGTFGEVITHHRGQSAYIFADICGSKRPLDEDEGDKEEREGQDRPSKAKRSGEWDHIPANQWKGLERKNPRNGMVRCAYYNKLGGCRKGNSCRNLSECDFPGFGKKHVRVDNHPTRPS